MSIDDPVGYELRADGRPIGIFRSLDQAQRIAADHIDAGRDVEIRSLSASVPGMSWRYDHARAAWDEGRPRSELQKAAHTGTASILADCDSAHAFLDIAQAAADQGSFDRNLALAQRALAAVDYFLGQLNVDAPLRDEVVAARDKLRTRIEGMRRA
ncbi:MAG: hypothetical protein GEV05_06895 [Betaproteobacteria bacterium]|nr:hypothetical protein [Betaproteobacteria bacterium]